MNLKGLLILGLFLSIGILNAQSNFKSGYIIKTTNDTIYGEIDSRGDLQMGSTCKFKSENGDVSDYLPSEISSYRFIDSKYYVSRELNGKQVFLEYLIKGEVNIYYLRDNKGDHYYLDKSDVKLTEIVYEVKVTKKDDKTYYYKTRRHAGLLNFYMQDAPELKSRIEKIKKPEHQNLVRLAEDYHNIICEGDQCLIYEKKPVLKVNFEAVGGIIKFGSEEGLVDKNYIQSGLLVHFWLPRTNEKLYFKTGVMYAQAEYLDGKRFTYITIPTHIGYLAPNNLRIRPNFSIGLISPSYSGGVLIRINKKINLGIQGWVNFHYDKLPFLPKKLYNYSLLGNVYIEL